MSPSIPVIVSGCTGGLFGAIVTAWFTIWRDGTIRKRSFRAFIHAVEFDLNTLMANWKNVHAGNPYFLYDWQKDMGVKLIAPCAAILDDIPDGDREQFIGLLMKLTTLGRRDVEPYEGKQPDKSLLYEDKQKELRALLNKMAEYAR
jgi:hypothetical protein